MYTKLDPHSPAFIGNTHDGVIISDVKGQLEDSKTRWISWPTPLPGTRSPGTPVDGQTLKRVHIYGTVHEIDQIKRVSDR